MNVPTVAVLLAFKVSVAVEVAGFGPKDAATPLGWPEADKETLLENPPDLWMLMRLVLAAPRATLRLVGEADRVKFGGVGTFTVRVILAVCVKPGEEQVPVMVTMTVPVAAVELAVNVKLLVPEPVTEVGLREAVTPLGRAE